MTLKTTILWLAILLPALFFGGCIKPQTEAFPAPPDLVATDTRYEEFAVDLETYRVDTINSTSRDFMFAGSYTDAMLGKLNAESYFQVLPTEYKSCPDTLLGIDSAKIIFRVAEEYGGSGKDAFGLHKLQAQLTGDASYYTISPSIPYSTDAYLTTTNAVRKGSFITLDATKFATEIFDAWKVDKNFSNDKNFLTKWPGFALRSTGQVPVISRISVADSAGYPSVFMQIYYRYISKGDVLNSTFNLKVNGSTVRYYKISVDPATTVFSQAKSGSGISAALTNGKSAVQGLTSLVTKITLPGLPGWKAAQTERIRIFKAELEIVPDDYPTTLVPPVYIRLSHNTDYYGISESNSNVVFNDPVVQSYVQRGQYTTAGAKSLILSQLFPFNSTTKKYKCNITSYVQDFLDGDISSNTINVYSESLGSSPARMLLAPGNVKLRVFYYPLTQ